MAEARSYTLSELRESWPEGWLGRRYSHGADGRKSAGDYVYVVPRRARTQREIMEAANKRWLNNGPTVSRLQVIWYWDDPEKLNVAPVGDN